MSAAHCEMPMAATSCQVRLRRVALAGVLLLPMLMGGCEPTPGELLVYEMVVVCVGLALGMSLWATGYRWGRRLYCRWFVCSHCLVPQPAKMRDGQTQPCTSCGQMSTVNELDHQTLREILPAGGTRVSAWPAWRWTLLLTVCTFGVFLSIQGVAVWLGRCGVSLDGKIPECALTPLQFCTLSCWPALGTALYFFSYHIVCAASDAAAAFGWGEAVVIPLSYAATAGAIGLHWYVGLRRWRRGWLLPLGVAGGNTIVALVGYVLKWPTIH